MAVTHDDVRHVAELARLAVDEARLDALVAELNGILGHMDVLSQVDTREVERRIFAPIGSPRRSAPIRAGRFRCLLRSTRSLPRCAMASSSCRVLPRHEDGVDRAP